jgi:hypothetical protein
MTGWVRGVIGGYFKRLGGAAKGAAGGEFLNAGGQLYQGARERLQVKACPRCFENSLVQTEGIFQCLRHDICGWEGDAVALKKAESVEPKIHPLVYVIAKGKQVEVERDYARNRFFSWVLWAVSLGVFLYAFYWLLGGRWFFAGWCSLVSFWLAIHAVRYAYRAQFLAGRFNMRPAAILKRPDLWFVT